jgi:hypothetical protein
VPREAYSSQKAGLEDLEAQAPVRTSGIHVSHQMNDWEHGEFSLNCLGCVASTLTFQGLSRAIAFNRKGTAAEKHR